MRYLKISKSDTDYRHMVNRVPDSITGDLVDTDTIVDCGDDGHIIYKILPKIVSDGFRHVVQNTKYQKSGRVMGLPTKSTVMGVMSRVAHRNDYCRFTAASYAETHNFAVMTSYNEYISSIYQEYLPEHYRAAMEEISTVDGSWRYVDTPYLTCNVNVNHAIPYHYDKGNMNKALSTVIIISSGVKGGELVCPEFGLTLSQRDGALTLFSGRNILHGVMPITYVSPESYRASIVYYSLSGMSNCLCRDEELGRIAGLTTHRNRNKYSEETKKKIVKINKKRLEALGSKWAKYGDNNKDETGLPG